MELRHVRYFLAVAEARNFTRAAEKVGIGQPPLSQQIRALEDELGTKLFHRRSYGAELTEAGEAFLPEAQAMLQQADRAMRAARHAGHGESGQLRVGFTSSASFSPVVASTMRAFRARYPAVALSFEEADTVRLLEGIVGKQLDAAFIRPGHDDPAGVTVQRIADEPMLVALPASHRLARSATVRLADLASETLLLFPRRAGPALFDDLLAACRRAGFDPDLQQETPQITSVANLVAAGFGISIVPAPIAQVQVAGVVYLPIAGAAPVAPLALATRHGEQSVTARNFIALIRAVRTGRTARPKRP